MAPEVGKTQFDKGLYDAAIVTLSLIGKNASQYSEAQRLIAMANSRIADNYKSSCKTMEYRVMEKNPDALAGMRVKLHGKIFYIREDSNSTFLLLLITYSDYGYGDWNDSVAVFFNGSFGAYRDDIITVWGEIKGAYTYESTAGYNVTVPSVNGEYVQYPKH